MATTTTRETITAKRIRALRNEAGAAGDAEQVRICDLALEGTRGEWRAWRRNEIEAAIATCVEAISSAEGQV